MSSSSWNPHFSNFIPNAKGGMQVDTSHKALKTPLQVPLSLKAVHMLPPGCAKIVSWVPDLILISASSNPQWRGSSFQVSLYAPHTWSTGTVCVCGPHTLLGILITCLFHNLPGVFVHMCGHITCGRSAIHVFLQQGLTSVTHPFSSGTSVCRSRLHWRVLALKICQCPRLCWYTQIIRILLCVIKSWSYERALFQKCILRSYAFNDMTAGIVN